MSTTRRDAIATFGAFAAGQAILSDAVAQENNPAANVADLSSTIRISRMTLKQVCRDFEAAGDVY